MSRLVSLIVLLVVLALVAVLFYQVMAGFFVPLFLALILVVMFRPLHRWLLSRLRNNKHAAAGLTTAGILLVVLAPLGIVLFQAAREGAGFVRRAAATADTAPAANKATGGNSTTVEATTATATSDVQQADGEHPAAVVQRLLARVVDSLNLPFSVEEQAKISADLVERSKAFLLPIAGGGAQLAGSTMLGLLVMVVAVYFFLLDGATMIDSVMEIIPMETRHKNELVARFVNVSRAIVTATLLAAVIQGLLAGVAYWMAGLPAVFLLTALTMLLAMVPFVGAMAVWLPCALWLYFHDQTAAAIALGIYGTVIVSQADNVIKPYVLHGQSNLHPLLALLSVLGGVQALGPIGIIIGPMAVAFLQTLLNMLRVELLKYDDEAQSPAPKLALPEGVEIPSGVDADATPR